MPDAGVRGRFVWHELMTTDLDAAGRFYGKVVGWTVQSSPHDPSYKLFVAADGPMAGLMLLPAEAKAMGAPPCWLSYVGTPNVDATAREAVMLGGRVVKEAMDIPTIGRFAVLADPQGAVFCIFTPVGAGGTSDAGPTMGDFSWHELITTDWQAAFAFYQRLFGWEKTEAMDMGPMGTYQMFGMRGKTMGGMFNKPPEMPAPPHWLPYALVKDARGAADLVKSAGGRVVNGPMEVPGGDWIVQFQDLQGVVFAVHSRAAAAKPMPKEPTKAPAAKAPAKKAPPKKAPAKKAAKKAPAKKAAKKAPAKKAVKKAPAKKAGKKAAKKAPAKKAAKKTAKKKAKKARRRATAPRKVMKKAGKARRKAAKKAAKKTTKKTRKGKPVARRKPRRATTRARRKAPARRRRR